VVAGRGRKAMEAVKDIDGHRDTQKVIGNLPERAFADLDLTVTKVTILARRA